MQCCATRIAFAIATKLSFFVCVFQKQYIFVYRALLEIAQFGVTEIKASKLKATLEKLRQVENGLEKSKMEEEFDVSKSNDFYIF